MTGQTASEITDDASETRPRLAWEVPEIAALVVLVAFVALALGGLVAGIIVSTELSGFHTQFTGAAITFGAAWAEPLLAIALLGVVGLSWWQIKTWHDLGEQRRRLDDHEVRGHIARACRIGIVAQAALILTAAGSLASLIGSVMVSSGADVAQSWSRYVLSGASLIGVLAITAGSWSIARNARAALPANVR